jgi:hypothetical protein
MKKKTGISIGTIWLLLLTAFLTPQLISIKSVSGLNGSQIFGIPNQMEEDEAYWTNSTAGAIKYYFDETEQYIYLQNYNGENTQNNLIYSVAGYLESYPYDFATIYYKGHSSLWDLGHAHNHSILYDNDGFDESDWAKDYLIGEEMEEYIHDFVFLWTCGMANEIGGIGGHTWFMPASYTHNADLTEDGFENPGNEDECFIGFRWYSKPYSDYTGHQSAIYATFVNVFYYKATVDGETIHNALNIASNYYLGDDLIETELYDGWEQYFPEMNITLYNQMRVFGNSNIELPN